LPARPTGLRLLSRWELAAVLVALLASILGSVIWYRTGDRTALVLHFSGALVVIAFGFVVNRRGRGQ
jgi:hypothetical protein